MRKTDRSFSSIQPAGSSSITAAIAAGLLLVLATSCDAPDGEELATCEELGEKYVECGVNNGDTADALADACEEGLAEIASIRCQLWCDMDADCEAFDDCRNDCYAEDEEP